MNYMLIDLKYFNLLNHERVEHKGDFKYNFRCKKCGDSKKSASKKHGFIEKNRNGKDKLHVYCHKCGFSGDFSFYLKEVNSVFFEEYRKEIREEKLKQKKDTPVVLPQKKEVEYINDDLIVDDLLMPLEKSPLRNIIEEYLVSRKIEKKYWKNIYYTDNFKKLINERYIKDKYKDIFYGDNRMVVFPIKNKMGKLTGLQGRYIFPKENFRYLTIRIKEEETLIYGIERIDENKDVFLVEGIFDSLVLDNCCAMLRDMTSIKFIEEQFSTDRVIFVFDNERHNKKVVENMREIANLFRYGLFLWPKNAEVKDLNELASKYQLDQQQVADYVMSGTIFGKVKKLTSLSIWNNK